MWEEYGSSWVFCQLKLTSKSISSSTRLRQASLGSSASCVQLGDLDCKSIPLTATAWKHTDEIHCTNHFKVMQLAPDTMGLMQEALLEQISLHFFCLCPCFFFILLKAIDFCD